MHGQTDFSEGGKLLKQMVEFARANNAPFLACDRELGTYKKVFEDADLISTVFCFFDNDLNVSKTAAKLYMHRNTLIYRLAKVKKLTSLDIGNFSDAVTFICLYHIYRTGGERA